MAELVEGAPLLREYGVKSSIEGSNPSLSATFTWRRYIPRRGQETGPRHGLSFPCRVHDPSNGIMGQSVGRTLP